MKNDKLNNLKINRKTVQKKNIADCLQEILLTFLLYLPVLIIPKKKNLWVFGCWNGQTYSDNAKYLFEYVNKEKKDIRPVWVTRNKKIYETLKKNGYNVASIYSWKWFWHITRAKLILYTNSRYDDLGADFIPPKKNIWAQIWHGRPMKANFREVYLENGISKNILDSAINPKGILGFFLTPIRWYIRNRRDADLMISCCAKDVAPLSEIFKIDRKKIKITGYPRNDGLFRLNDDTGLKKIIYLPTWRESGTVTDLFKKFKFNWKKMDKTLEKHNAQLIIKLHYNDKRAIPEVAEIIKNSKRIELSQNDDIYEQMGACSILIADYSSVYFDYLILNRPIIFASFDKEEYLKETGIIYNYNDVAPGPKAKDWDEIIKYLEVFLIKPSEYKKERKKVQCQFNHFCDNKNCERTYREIKKIANR